MSIKITVFETQGGAPYSSYTPTISIWNATSNASIISNTAMTNIGSSIYKYDFASYVYGTPYVYLITGDTTNQVASECYQWGAIMQDTPDRVIGTVGATATSTSFYTSRTEATGTWNNTLCLFLSGTLLGQVQQVTTYSNTNGVLNFTTRFTDAPTAGDSFELVNF